MSRAGLEVYPFTVPCATVVTPAFDTLNTEAPVEDATLKRFAVCPAVPATVRFDAGVVVPIPTKPTDPVAPRMVSFAAPEGPIIVEEAVLLVMLEPMAMAPCAEAMLL